MIYLLIIFGVATVIFLIYKLLFILLTMGAIKVLRLKLSDTFVLILSISLFYLFIFIYILTAATVEKKYGITLMEDYIAFCIIGLISVVWVYFSWSAIRLFARPRWATAEELRAKKITIYVSLLVFAFFIGFEQVNSVANGTKVDSLFSFTNYSIITIIIAMDRILNQIYPK